MAFGGIDQVIARQEMQGILDLMDRIKEKSPQEQLDEIKRYAEERLATAKSGWL